MKKLILVPVIVLLAAFLFAETAEAQTLEQQLQSLAGSAAKGYVAPLTNGFITGMNGGWFRRAPKDKVFGIDLEAGLVVMATQFDDEKKSIPAGLTGSFRLDYNQANTIVTNSGIPVLARPAVINELLNQDFNVAITGPTVIGSTADTVIIRFPAKVITVGATNYNLQPSNINTGVTGLLENATMFPMLAPQISLGTVWGTMVSVRYLPELEVEDIGKFKYFGFGVQHNPKVWPFIPFLGMLPVDLSLSFFTQNLEIGSLFTTSTTSFGVNVSKQLGFGFLNLTPYAGFMLESGKMEFKYDAQIETAPGTFTTVPIGFEIEGENTSRIVVGASLRLLVINLNVDYNIGTYNSLTAGVMFAF